jgi:hypothetical protein
MAKKKEKEQSFGNFLFSAALFPFRLAWKIVKKAVKFVVFLPLKTFKLFLILAALGVLGWWFLFGF